MQRFSKKRQAILDCVLSTRSHPTAEWVYEHLKDAYPDMSLATVYRNLGQLRDAGIISSIGIVNGEERYDGVTDGHPHAVCSVCGQIIDIPRIDIPPIAVEEIRKQTGFTVSNTMLRFSGICSACIDKSKKENEE